MTTGAMVVHVHRPPTWLPDGYRDSQIFRLSLFGHLGLKDYGYATMQNLIPSFPSIVPGWRAGIKFCHLDTLTSETRDAFLVEGEGGVEEDLTGGDGGAR